MKQSSGHMAVPMSEAGRWHLADCILPSQPMFFAATTACARSSDLLPMQSSFVQTFVQTFLRQCSWLHGSVWNK